MSQLNNPYAPPEADDEPAISSLDDGIVLASQGARFVNFLIDNVVRVVFSVMVTVLSPGISPIVRGVLSIVVTLGYYLVLEVAFQATVGKLVTRTRVVTANGGKPSFAQILGRTFSRFVPFEPLSLLGRQPVGWHDSWSGTRVVKLESIRAT